MASRSASTRASLGPHSWPGGAGWAVAAHSLQKTHEKHAHVGTASSATSLSVRAHREHSNARSVSAVINGGRSAARCEGRTTRPLVASTAPKARASVHEPTISTCDAAPSFATSARFWPKERRSSSASARSVAHAASPASRSAATTLRGKRQRSASCSRAMESMTVSGTPAAARRARISAGLAEAWRAVAGARLAGRG